MISPEVGTGISLSARFGPSITGPEAYAPTLVNEGPVAPNFLENSMPIATFNPVGEIKFNTPVKEGLVVVTAHRAEPLIVPAAVPQEWVYSPWVTTAPKPIITLATTSIPKTESKISTQPAQAVSIQPAAKEQEVEKVAEEKVLAEESQEPTNEIEDKEDSLFKVRFVEAKEISEKRRKEISAAVKKSRGGFVGKWLKTLLSMGFWQSTSPIVEKGKDQTIDLTIADIESDPIEYKTPEEAERAWVKAVDRNIPVKEGENGRSATVEEVKKVIQGEYIHPSLQSNTPAEIVVRRVVKEKIEFGRTGRIRILEDRMEVGKETNLEELSPALAEVFKRQLDRTKLSG